MMQNQNQWYVQVSGQSYGPYSMAQMIAFIGEGRIIAGSLISQDATQGFAMALQSFLLWRRLTPRMA